MRPKNNPATDHKVRPRGRPAIKRPCWYCDGTGYVQDRQA